MSKNETYEARIIREMMEEQQRGEELVRVEFSQEHLMPVESYA